MISSLLYSLNHAPLWQRKVRVWDQTVEAASLDRLVFLCLHWLGWMGKGENYLLRELVEPGMEVIDVGANIGLYSLLLASLTGKTGRVRSFEPEPNLFATFSRNCVANDASNIVPLPFAAGNANAHAAFERSTFNSGNNNLSADGTGSVQVEVVRIDDALTDAKADFVKMDVQGHELAALSGMEHLLASNSAVRVLFEFWPGGLRAAGTDPEALLDFFTKRGFTIYATEDRCFRELTDPDELIRDLGEKRYTNLLASRTGVPARA